MRPTNVQLIKLVNIAHGWAFVSLDRPLVDEHPQAWQHGPVFPKIYREFREAGSRSIAYAAINSFTQAEDTSSPMMGRRSSIRSSQSTADFTPLRFRQSYISTLWHTIWNDGAGKFDAISNDLTKAHYQALNERPA